jgi:hypothetical protein
MRAAARYIVIAGLLLGLSPSHAPAQSPSEDSWNPFKWLEPAPRRKPPEPPVDRANLERMPPAGVRNRPVESSDLAPVMAPDTSGLPLDLWRGLEMADIERLLAGLDLSPRSTALHQLWRRMLLSSASPPAGAPSADHFMALRLEALYRSGLLGDMAEVERGAAAGPLARVVLARKDIGLGAREAGRVPQPASGYLPETGVLADLAQSAQRKDTGRTILLAMRALGPNGAEGANILALGDAVRALKRVGLEPDARRLAFEALFAVWPRTPGL